MTWLTWRQFRLPVAAVLVAVVVFAVTLVLTVSGLDVPGTGQDYLAQLSENVTRLYTAASLVMYVLPGVVGVFWGAPMVARELEAGTHRLVWNQTVTRTRWLATKLGIGGLVAMAAAGVTSLVVGWWAAPIDDAASTGGAGFFSPRIAPEVFSARGIVPMGYALFAFVLGVTVGVLLRRTVAAMAVTLVVFVAVQVLFPAFVRPHLLPPVEQTVAVSQPAGLTTSYDSNGRLRSIMVPEPNGVWMVANETVDPSGNAISELPAVVVDCVPPIQIRYGSGGGSSGFDQVPGCIKKLDDMGYHQRLAFQPGSRFWPLQGIELGIYLVLSGLLAWFGLRWTRDRLS